MFRESQIIQKIQDGILKLSCLASAYLLIRKAMSDTVLKLPRTDNPNVIDELPIPKGTDIVLDFVGMGAHLPQCLSLIAYELHTGYDPQTFPDPESFKPWRWSKAKTRDMAAEPTQTERQASEVSPSSSATAPEGFIGSSFGHKFAKIEAVYFLTHLVRELKIEPEARS